MTRTTVRRCAALAAARAAAAAPARADVFDGRIAFTSFRADPTLGLDRGGDILHHERRRNRSAAADDQRARSPARLVADGDRHRLHDHVAGGDTDRGIFVVNADGSGLTTLFDVPGAYDSAPAWSPDATRIAFESNADVAGANPEGDMEIWTMAADGSDATQLTHNALHDEGPAWSPDGGRLIAYTSGVDNEHGDTHVMTAAGEHLRRLTSFLGLDESPDWQATPAPSTTLRCGDAARHAGAHDVRARGSALPCPGARALARRWIAAGQPRRISRFAVQVRDYGGVRRVVMTRATRDRRQLVAFLYQPPARP
jgi:hypothetical protein